MKRLFFLFVPLVFLFSCEEKKILTDELVNKSELLDHSTYVHYNSFLGAGPIDIAITYYQGKPFTGTAYDVDEDGFTIVEGKFKNGFKEGLWRYNYSGYPCYTVNYLEGQLDGVWTHYYYNDTYSNCYCDEEGVWVYPTNISQEQFYKNGRLEKMVNYFKNGQKAQILKSKPNRKQGWSQFKLVDCWDKNGNNIDCDQSLFTFQ